MAYRNMTSRKRRKLRIRKRVNGTTDRPRMTIFRSARHIYGQIIDDVSGKTLASASSLLKAVGAEGNKVETAKRVGAALAEACKGQNITKVVFDRNGFLYHGRIKALADAAREAGLDF